MNEEMPVEESPIDDVPVDESPIDEIPIEDEPINFIDDPIPEMTCECITIDYYNETVLPHIDVLCFSIVFCLSMLVGCISIGYVFRRY